MPISHINNGESGLVARTAINAVVDIANNVANAMNDTVTASTPLLNMAQTWNNAAVAFTGIKLNITNTASSSTVNAAKLFDFQVGGGSFMYAGSDGNVVINQQTGTLAVRLFDVQFQGASSFYVVPSGVGFPTGKFIQFDSLDGLINFAGGPQLVGYNTGDSTAFALEQRNGTNAQTFRVYNTYTDRSNWERGIFDWNATANTLTIATEKLGTGSVRPIVIKTPSGGGAYAITLDGGATIGDYIKLAAGSGIDVFLGGSLLARFGARLNLGSQGISMGTSVGFEDTGVTRSAAGVIAVGNGTAGDTSGTVKATNAILIPPASVTPANNGELTFEATSNTSLTFKYKGSDGTVRSAALTLA